MTHALIVGGGIAGISTALALRRQGTEVDLVERDAEIRTLGSGITLIYPAMRALRRLGVLDQCLEVGYGTSKRVICDINGDAQQVRSLPSELGSGMPGMMGMMRPQLHRILLGHAASLGLSARTGLSPAEIVYRADRAEVKFSDGAEADYDLVIGADGLRSTVREVVCGPVSPVFQGQTCYRIVVPRLASVTSEVAFVGCDTAHIGFTPIRTDSMYINCLIGAKDTAEPPQDELPALVREYLAPFGGVVAKLRDGITDPDQVNCAPVETIVAPAPWFRDRVVLVGDAAHTTTPHLAAGAAMCMEDALVLGEELARHDEISAALEAYSERRFDRCKYVVETSAQLCQWQIHPNTPGADQEGLRGAGFLRLAGHF
jgi:2-polyprenyl-6-methoxyphenol hydroxylase-like FAD-dependent oxidoreductase